MSQNDEIETQEVEVISPAQTVLALDLPLGDVLKNTREEKGIELETVAESLCIRESFLSALEEGDYSSFPALVYGAGFLRSYASYLGLDAEQMTKKFHHETAHLKETYAEPHTVKDKNVVPTKRFLTTLFLLILFVASVCYFCGQKEQEPENKDVLAQDLQPAVAPVVLAVDANIPPVLTDSLVQTLPNDRVESLSGEKEAKPVDLKALVPVSKEADSAKDATSAKGLEEGAVYGEKEGARLFIKATAKVWVEVKSADKVVLNRVLATGDSYYVPAGGTDYILKTGNAGALEVYVDGVFKKVLGKKGHVVKDVELTPSAFENE